MSSSPTTPRRRTRSRRAASPAARTSAPDASSPSTSASVAAPSSEAASFEALGVPADLVAVLGTAGITAPFPIQSATLPDSLAGRDVLGRGRTGSGKTVAFAVPMVERLRSLPGRRRPTRPRGLVLLPTRELAAQVHATLEPLARAAGLTTATVYGGVSQRQQVQALTRGVDILVACPGRLEDLMQQGHVHLDDVLVTVLDEADHMADLGFLPGVKRILDSTPADGQRLLFSATLDRGVDTLVKRYLSHPVTHSVDDDVRTEPDMEHHILTVKAADKPAVVRDLAGGTGRSVLFVRTKHGARKLARTLTQSGIPAVDLHGNLAQNARDRNMEAFRSGEVSVLVATDIAARGIHVDDIGLVVHVDPPTEHKAYLHRSGRTARAGASGIVVTLQTSDQAADVDAMTRKAGISVRPVRALPGAPEILSLSGPRAAHVEPAAPPASQKVAASGGRRRGQRPHRAASGRSRTSAR